VHNVYQARAVKGFIFHRTISWLSIYMP